MHGARQASGTALRGNPANFVGEYDEGANPPLYPRLLDDRAGSIRAGNFLVSPAPFTQVRVEGWRRVRVQSSPRICLRPIPHE